jgi:hypothetical protein
MTAKKSQGPESNWIGIALQAIAWPFRHLGAGKQRYIYIIDNKVCCSDKFAFKARYLYTDSIVFKK